MAEIVPQYPGRAAGSAWAGGTAGAAGPWPQQQLPRGADRQDRDHGVLGAAAPDPVTVPSHAVPAVPVQAQPGGPERLTELVGVVGAQPVAGRALHIVVADAAVRDAATGQGMRLRVGISDGLPKLVVRHLLRPAVDDGAVRLLCHEDEFEGLLADLALHRLDVVLSDRAAPSNPNLRLYSHKLGEAPLVWFAPKLLVGRRTIRFPQCLADMPILLPTGDSAVRPRIDQWLERKGLLQKHSAPFKLTKRSLERVEEPAYFLDS